MPSSKRGLNDIGDGCSEAGTRGDSLGADRGPVGGPPPICGWGPVSASDSHPSKLAWEPASPSKCPGSVTPILMAARGGGQSRRLVLGRFERFGLYGHHALVVRWFIAGQWRGQVLWAVVVIRSQITRHEI